MVSKVFSGASPLRPRARGGYPAGTLAEEDREGIGLEVHAVILEKKQGDREAREVSGVREGED